MIKPQVGNDKKSRVMDYGFLFLLDMDSGQFPTHFETHGRSAQIRKIRTTIKQPSSRMGFKRGQRR